jgi:hypothetical protein
MSAAVGRITAAKRTLAGYATKCTLHRGQPVSLLAPCGQVKMRTHRSSRTARVALLATVAAFCSLCWHSTRTACEHLSGAVNSEERFQHLYSLHCSVWHESWRRRSGLSWLEVLHLCRFGVKALTFVSGISKIGPQLLLIKHQIKTYFLMKCTFSGPHYTYVLFSATHILEVRKSEWDPLQNINHSYDVLAPSVV